jgi:apolipoprotein D and lipocalin family protein
MQRAVRIRAIFSLACLFLLSACANQSAMKQEPLPVSDNIDIQQFMGRWYVIANIPTFIERQAYNAVEEYEWQGDGKVATTFTYNNGALDGPLKKANPTGFVSPDNNAVWKMQFIWPFKADYRVMYVDDEHSITVIGREKRDYVWLMARSPDIDQKTYQNMVALIQNAGYDISKLREIPHSANQTTALAN